MGRVPGSSPKITRKFLDTKATEINIENASSKEIERPRRRNGKPHARRNAADDGPISAQRSMTRMDFRNEMGTTIERLLELIPEFPIRFAANSPLHLACRRASGPARLRMEQIGH